MAATAHDGGSSEATRDAIAEVKRTTKVATSGGPVSDDDVAPASTLSGVDADAASKGVRAAWRSFSPDSDGMTTNGEDNGREFKREITHWSTSTNNGASGSGDDAIFLTVANDEGEPSGGATPSVPREGPLSATPVAEAAPTPSSPEGGLRSFQTSRHSLRLSASRIAALSGYHPYADLPRLLFDLVYQGRLGWALLRRDAGLLGLELRTDEECLEDLARRGGAECERALAEAMKVRDEEGVAAVCVVADAEDIKVRARSAVAGAGMAGKLTVAEVRKLGEGMRSLVDTGFGTRHEEAALDLYEHICGFEVRERNAEVREWKFERVEDEDGGDGEEDGGGTKIAEEQGDTGTAEYKTVRPVGPAEVLHRKSKRETEEKESNVGAKELNNEGEDALDSATTEPLHKRPKIIERSGDGEVETPTDVGAEEIDGEIALLPSDAADGEGVMSSKLTSSKKKRPFFSILGAVDGIRDELCFQPAPAPSLATNEFDAEDRNEFDDGGMVLRPLVVECKHRMSRTMDPPPLYDQIQAVAYCLMYGTDGAEIVQAVRRRRKRGKEGGWRRGRRGRDEGGIRSGSEIRETEGLRRSGNSERTKSEGHLRFFGCEGVQGGQLTQLSSCEDSVAKPLTTALSEEPSASGPEDRTAANADASTALTQMDLTVSRISLDDPTLHHRRHWHHIILPRLRSFVDAAYNVRANDGLRYRLLASIAGATHAEGDNGSGCAAHDDGKQEEERAWGLVFQLCPWVEDCDTPYSRRWGRQAACPYKHGRNAQHHVLP